MTVLQTVLFGGYDLSGKGSLWVTDGTAAGTYELTGISGVYAGGLFPYDITVFNGEVLFGGYDSNGQTGLWVTDGTAAGTHELTGISGVNNTNIGLEPADMTVFNGEVLSLGYNSSGQAGLWVTDGTAAGTHELTGISGANALGVSPIDMTVFNGEVLFQGYDSSSQDGLWVTDGTAAGTHELTGISGTYAGGLFVGGIINNMTVFNGEVLFQGYDSSGQGGLWVTNGTAAGTYELTGISGANAQGLYPTDITVFNGEVLFGGYDSNGQAGLWVTDGTAAGTHELTGISGAFWGGLRPSVMTVFNGEVLFFGLDTYGQSGLWVTDGTAAGTHELVSGIYYTNATGPIGPSYKMTVFNGEVLFGGNDSSGQAGLWVTDGTAAGTHELTGISGANALGVNPWELTVFSSLQPPTIDLAHSVVTGTISERANTTGSALVDTVSGALAFTDQDLLDRPTASIDTAHQTVTWQDSNGHTFALTVAQMVALGSVLQIAEEVGNTNTGKIDWTYSIADKNLDFIGAGETVTVTTPIVIDDHNGGTVTENVVVTINGANDNPVGIPDGASVQTGATLTVDTTHGVLANDTDPDIHDTLTVSAVNGSSASVGHTITGAYGNLTLNTDGSYIYVANNHLGAAASRGALDIFTYTVDDGHGGTAISTLSVTVGAHTPPALEPVATADTATVQMGGTIKENATQGVLSNDTDPHNYPLSVIAVDDSSKNVGHTIAGTYGTLTLKSDGSFNYVETSTNVPNGAQDVFTYTVSDGHGGVAASTLTIDITPIVAALVAYPVAGTYEISQGNRSDPSDKNNDHGTNLTPHTNGHHYNNMPLQWAYDFLVPKFTPVYAVAAGTVVYVYDNFKNSQLFSGYGNVVTIESTVNGETFYTTYAHLAGLDNDPASDPIQSLYVGETISVGQEIALSGSTGTPGAHLHIQFGTQLYSADTKNGDSSTLATSHITYNGGAIADGQNDAVAPAYFQQLNMNLNNNGNSNDQFYTGMEGSDHFIANLVGDTVVTNGGADLITLDAVTQTGRLSNHVELYRGASLVTQVDPAASATLKVGVVPAVAGSIVDNADTAQGGFWGISGSGAEFGGLGANHGTNADMSTVTNFKGGAAPGGDILDFSVSAWGSGGNNSAGGLNHGLTTGDLVAHPGNSSAGMNAVIQQVTPGQSVLATTDLAELSGTFANADAAVAALHSETGKFIFAAALPNKDDAHMLVAYQDLSNNAHIMDVEFSNTSGFGPAPEPRHAMTAPVSMPVLSENVIRRRFAS